MRKTTVYLPDDLKVLLERAAVAEGRSEAELIREAVQQRVAAHARPRPRIPLTAEGFGRPDAARRVDDLLRGGFGGSGPSNAPKAKSGRRGAGPDGAAA